MYDVGKLLYCSGRVEHPAAHDVTSDGRSRGAGRGAGGAQPPRRGGPATLPGSGRRRRQRQPQPAVPHGLRRCTHAFCSHAFPHIALQRNNERRQDRSTAEHPQTAARHALLTSRPAGTAAQVSVRCPDSFT